MRYLDDLLLGLFIHTILRYFFYFIDEGLSLLLQLWLPCIYIMNGFVDLLDL